jgi:sirohydrochlorin cobaltochelatase
MKILSKDFLPAAEGCNVIVAHGSPRTAVGSNSTYLGLDRYLSRHFRNVFLGCVEGILTREDGLEPAKAFPGQRVRFLPLMFVGGDHVMGDIMGDGDSWRREIEKTGKTVDIPEIQVAGETQYRGLGLIPDVNAIFIREIRRALGRL